MEFKVGDIVIHRMTGEKLMILVACKSNATGEEKMYYTVRLPNYQRSTDIQGFELSACEDKE